jgi:TRAP-type C4-dicarboxylate transport system substrate-binding protein
MKGMTIRTQTSGVVKEFWDKCGAIPTAVAWGELYQALQQGVVDSAENDYTNLMLKEHQKTPNGKYISETQHDWTTRLLLTSGAFWNKLNDQQKQWVTAAAQACTQEERDVTNKMLGQSKAKCIADGAIVTEFKDIDIAAFKAIAIPIQDNFAKSKNMQSYLDMVRDAK